MTLAPGTKLDPHEVVAPLGAGGVGEVYRATDLRLARFEGEVKLLPSLDLPNVPGARHLVLEFVEGERLAALVDRLLLARWLPR